MNIPLYSTITLLAEILITAAILYIFYFAYKRNRFLFKLTAFVLSYETLFNISYMAYRALTHAETKQEPTFIVALAAFHGIFSLIMFITLIAFLVLAWRYYGRGVNYFLVHRAMTFFFLLFWMIAVLSGIALYFAEYIFV